MCITHLAQSQHGAVSISLEQAIQQSLLQNKSITTATLYIEQQKQLKRTAMELPKTNIDYTQGQYNSIVSRDNGISISQVIPFPTVLVNQNKLGKANIEGAKLKKYVAENELIYKVKQTYYQWLFLTTYHEVLIQQDSIYKQVVKATALRYKTGEGTMLEKITAESRADEIRNTIRQSEADQIILQRQLQNLIFSDAPINISDQQLTERSLDFLLDSINSDNNPPLAYAKQQIQITDRVKQVEVSKALPDFIFGYFNQTLIGYQNINNTDVYFGPNKRFQGFKVGISLPIWFVPNHARNKAMRIAVQEEVANYESHKMLVQSQLDQAIQSYLKNKSSLAYYQTSAKPKADVILNHTIIAFNQGDISYNDHLSNMQQALTIRHNYLETLNRYNQSIIYLEYLIGVK